MSVLRSIGCAALVSVTALGFAGCGEGGGAKTAKVAAGPMPEGETWTGVYYHPVFGYLHMQETDANVVGRWKRTDHTHWGEMSGTSTGNVLRFTWKEHKIGMVGAAATTQGKGYFVYKVNKENIGELQGEFGMGQDEAGSSWNNLKQARMPPDLKSIGGDSEGVTPGQLSN